MYRNKKLGFFVVATHKIGREYLKVCDEPYGHTMSHKQAAIRYSVASHTFATTSLINDVTALVIQGSSSAKFVGSGGTNSKSHDVSSGDPGDQEHHLKSHTSLWLWAALVFSQRPKKVRRDIDGI
jgi:hypothetical protein